MSESKRSNTSGLQQIATAMQAPNDGMGGVTPSVVPAKTSHPKQHLVDLLVHPLLLIAEMVLVLFLLYLCLSNHYSVLSIDQPSITNESLNDDKKHIQYDLSFTVTVDRDTGVHAERQSASLLGDVRIQSKVEGTPNIITSKDNIANERVWIFQGQAVHCRLDHAIGVPLAHEKGRIMIRVRILDATQQERFSSWSEINVSRSQE